MHKTNIEVGIGLQFLCGIYNKWSLPTVAFLNKWEMHNVLKYLYACKRVLFIAKITICGLVVVCLSIASFHRSTAIFVTIQKD